MKTGQEKRSRIADVQYFAASLSDIPEMADLFLRTVSDMYARNNISAVLPHHHAVSQSYAHILSTGIFYAAKLREQIVAIAGGVVRDHLFYLSAFWTTPDMQLNGVGTPLLRTVCNAGRDEGATVLFTWSSVDLAAIASYMKLGMLPSYHIFLLEGVPVQVPNVSSDNKVVDLEKSAAVMLDREVRGTGRQQDHDFWVSLTDMKGRQVLRDGATIGYYYLSKGVIGPVSWLNPQDAEPLMTIACREAAETSATINFAVPGINHQALKFALASSLQLTRFAHFLTTTPFGRMEQYLPSGPMLY